MSALFFEQNRDFNRLHVMSSVPSYEGTQVNYCFILCTKLVANDPLVERPRPGVHK